MLNTNNIPMASVKTCIYSKKLENGMINFMTVVYSVPKECIGRKMASRDTFGVFATNRSLTRDNALVYGTFPTTLTKYEKVLSIAGWRFLTTCPITDIPVEEAMKKACMYVKGIHTGMMMAKGII